MTIGFKGTRMRRRKELRAAKGRCEGWQEEEEEEESPGRNLKPARRKTQEAKRRLTARGGLFGVRLAVPRRRL